MHPVSSLLIISRRSLISLISIPVDSTRCQPISRIQRLPMSTIVNKGIIRRTRDRRSCAALLLAPLSPRNFAVNAARSVADFVFKTRRVSSLPRRIHPDDYPKRSREIGAESGKVYRAERILSKTPVSLSRLPRVGGPQGRAHDLPGLRLPFCNNKLIIPPRWLNAARISKRSVEKGADRAKIRSKNDSEA